MSIPAVRQAICYAIDRNAICEYLYSGLGETPIDSIMAPSVAGYASVGVVPYDPEKAKQLLADPRNKINEIAARVGYGDQNYFGKTFKKVVGLSPSEYREKESL